MSFDAAASSLPESDGDDGGVLLTCRSTPLSLRKTFCIDATCSAAVSACRARPVPRASVLEYLGRGLKAVNQVLVGGGVASSGGHGSTCCVDLVAATKYWNSNSNFYLY